MDTIPKPSAPLKILVTGAAGFIGFSLSKRLLEQGDEVVGLDNLNDYYDVNLKLSRLKQITMQENFKPVRLDLADRDGMARLFKEENFDVVVNLAAQAGVRYSLINPMHTLTLILSDSSMFSKVAGTTI